MMPSIDQRKGLLMTGGAHAKMNSPRKAVKHPKVSVPRYAARSACGLMHDQPHRHPDHLVSAVSEREVETHSPKDDSKISVRIIADVQASGVASSVETLPPLSSLVKSFSHKEFNVQILTVPTILTLSRVAAIPALIGAWFGASSATSPFLTAVIFLTACVTDFFDGYLARKMGTHSPFGAFLDPVADKLMVSTVLILLSSRPFISGSFAGNSWLMPTIASAIIGREIAMSALREWAASLGSEAHQAVAVSPLGKWKTTTQMTALVFLLASSGGSRGSLVLEACATAGPPLLLVAAFLTLFSLYEYLKGLWKYLV